MVWLVVFCLKKLNRRFNFIVKTLIFMYYSVNIYIIENAYILVAYNGNIFPTGNYLFNITNRNTRPRCEISSDLPIKTSE